MLPWVAPDIEHVVEYAGSPKKFSTRPKTHPSSAQGSNFWRLAYWGFRLSECGQNGNIQQMKRLVYAPLLCTPNQLGTSGGAPQDLELIQSRAYSHQLLPAIPWRQKKRKKSTFLSQFLSYTYGQPRQACQPQHCRRYLLYKVCITNTMCISVEVCDLVKTFRKALQEKDTWFCGELFPEQTLCWNLFM